MDKIKPVRLQRSRKKGSKLKSPNGLPVVYVGRGSKWGNPFHTHGDGIKMDNALALQGFKMQLSKHGGFIAPGKKTVTTIEDIKRELKGKDLACWCRLDQPCHADVLLELANQESEVSDAVGS